MLRVRIGDTCSPSTGKDKDPNSLSHSFRRAQSLRSVSDLRTTRVKAQTHTYSSHCRQPVRSCRILADRSENNFRGDDGNVGIIRSPISAIVLPDNALKQANLFDSKSLTPQAAEQTDWPV
jgi:hypothetical protein